MTMKRSLAAVRNALAEVIGTVRELAVVVDDCPPDASDLAVVEALRARAAEVEGDIAETAEALAAAADDPRRIAEAHERFGTACSRVRFSLSAHDSLFALERLAVRSRPARRWTEIVLRQLEQIDHALGRAEAAFIACWHEVADRSAAVHHPLAT